MIVLAIDTASRLCAACVFDSDTGRELGRAVLDLGKGHAEHLMGVVDDALKAAHIGFDALERIVVSVGPGSFTGVRVGVACARGFAMALKIPALGVTTLEAIAQETRQTLSGQSIMVALDGGRGEINLALYDHEGAETLAPRTAGLEGAASLAREHRPVMAGSAARLVADDAGGDFTFGLLAATADVATYARIGALKAAGTRPTPLYLREADAKPQAGFVLPRTGA